MTGRKPTHPGAVFREDVLKPMNLTATKAALILGETVDDLSKFLREEVSLSAELAIKIARATYTTPEAWLNIQTKLDLWKAYLSDPAASVVPGCMSLSSTGKESSFISENEPNPFIETGPFTGEIDAPGVVEIKGESNESRAGDRDS